MTAYIGTAPTYGLMHILSHNPNDGSAIYLGVLQIFTYDRMGFYFESRVDGFILLKPQVLNTITYVTSVSNYKKSPVQATWRIQLGPPSKTNRPLVCISTWGFHSDWNFLSKRVSILKDSGSPLVSANRFSNSFRSLCLLQYRLVTILRLVENGTKPRVKLKMATTLQYVYFGIVYVCKKNKNMEKGQ